jgi:hypothetical protein
MFVCIFVVKNHYNFFPLTVFRKTFIREMAFLRQGIGVSLMKNWRFSMRDLPNFTPRFYGVDYQYIKKALENNMKK